MARYDYLLNNGTDLYESAGHVPFKLEDTYVFEDVFGRADGSLGNGWSDLFTSFPLYFRMYAPGEAANAAGQSGAPIGVHSDSFLITDLTTQQADCNTISMGNLTLTGAKSAGTAGDTTQTATTDGWRCLVWNQTAKKDNGIYVVNHAGAWTRATDADTSGEVAKYTWCFVSFPGPFGTFGYQRYVQSTASPTIGVSDLVYKFGYPTGYLPAAVYTNCEATGTVADKGSGASAIPVGEFASVASYRDGIRTDNYEVEVIYTQGTDTHASTFVSQGGPIICVDPASSNTEKLGILLGDDVALSGGDNLPLYLSQVRFGGSTGPQDNTEGSGLIWANFPAISWAPTNSNKITLRVVGGYMAGYINESRVCGPVPVPSWASSRTNYGAWSCVIPNGLFPGLPYSNTRLFSRVTHRFCNKALGSIPSAVTFPTSSAVTTVSSGTTIDVPYPVTQNNDKIFMVIASTPAGTFDVVQNPTGWTNATISGVGARPSDSSVRLQVWARTTPADGTESGTVRLTHTVLGTPSAFTKAKAWMFTARHWNLRSPIQSAIIANDAASTTLTGPDANLATQNNTVLWIGACGAGASITAPSGFTTVQQVGTGDVINMHVASRVFDVDTDLGYHKVSDVLGVSTINGTLGSSVPSVGWSAPTYHDPR